MDLTTNGVIITDAIKFVHINKEKLTRSVREEQNGKEIKDIDKGEDDEEEDGDQLEDKSVEETGELKEETTNQVF